MNNEEAINSLKDRYETVSMCLTSDECKMRNKALDIAIKCIEKQIPRKPEMFIDRTSWVECYACPTCKDLLGKGCGCANNTCNQRIDWSEVE